MRGPSQQLLWQCMLLALGIGVLDGREMVASHEGRVWRSPCVGGQAGWDAVAQCPGLGWAVGLKLMCQGHWPMEWAAIVGAGICMAKAHIVRGMVVWCAGGMQGGRAVVYPLFPCK